MAIGVASGNIDLQRPQRYRITIEVPIDNIDPKENIRVAFFSCGRPLSQPLSDACGLP